MKLFLYLFPLLFLFITSTPAQTPTLEFQQSYGGSLEDYTRSLELTNDGGFIFCGLTESNDGDVSGSHGEEEFWLVKAGVTGEIEWQKCLGGSLDDLGWAMKQTSDGGYILTGFSESNDGDVTGNHGDYDYWVIKTDATGNIQWQKSLGGTKYDAAYDIQLTTDNGYIIAGTVKSKDGDVTSGYGNKDAWIIKLDSTGTIQWQKDMGGSIVDDAFAIQQTIDGGYIVAGNSSSNDGDVSGGHGSDDYWVVKLSATGSIEWQRCYGGSASDVARSVQQTADGNYIVIGFSESNDGDVSGNHGLNDVWVIKINSGGNLISQKCFGGSGEDYGRVIQKTDDGGYLIAAASGSTDGDVTGNHGQLDYWVAKIGASQNIQWQKSAGGSREDYAYTFKADGAGNYFIGGFSRSNDYDVTGNHGGEDVWIAKLSSNCSISFTNAVVNETCPGNNGSIDLIVSGGQAPFDFNWSNGATTEDISGLTAGTYSVIVTDGVGCITSVSIIVTDNKAPTANEATITAGGATTFCSGGSVLLSVGTGGLTYQWLKNGAVISGQTMKTYLAKKTATYSCNVSSSCATTMSNSIAVTQNTKPGSVVTQALCSGGSVLLTCTPTPNTGITFQWKKGSNVQSGATNSTFSATSNGTYKCIVTISETGCTKTSEGTIVSITCKTGDEAADMELTFYPNPTSDYFNIKTTQLDAHVLIYIYDVTGRLVESDLANSSEIKVCEALPNGIYFARIVTNNETNKIYKLVKSF